MFCKNERIYFCLYHNNHNKSAQENLRKKCLYCPHNNQTILIVRRIRNGTLHGINYRNINHCYNALHPSSNRKHIVCRPNNKDHRNRLAYKTDYIRVGHIRNNLIRHHIDKQFLSDNSFGSTLHRTYFHLLYTKHRICFHKCRCRCS